MANGDYISFQRTQFAEALAQLREARVPRQAARQGAGLAAEHPAQTVEMTASIILVNYNGWHDLQRCLASLEASPVEGCEVIVIDNNSTDDSPQRIEQRFPTVRLIRSAINLGFGAGNNLGAKLALGRVLVFLNPDTTVEPGWLGPLVGA